MWLNPASRVLVNFGSRRFIDCKSINALSKSNGSFSSQVFTQTFNVRFHVQIPTAARHVKKKPRCQARTTWHSCSLGLVEHLRNVNVIPTLTQLQQVASNSISCWFVTANSFQKLFGCDSTQPRVIRFAGDSLSSKPIQQTVSQWKLPVSTLMTMVIH